jgi:hypothetical protein
MMFWRFARKAIVCLVTILVILAAVAASYKLLKMVSRQAKLGLWPQEPSLESLDPTERIDAAREAARKYGGKP